MKKFFFEEESGQGMVEYALIVGLISVVAISAIQAIGGNTQSLFVKIKEALEKANDDYENNADLGTGGGDD